MITIERTAIFVDDQQRAVDFYTEVLGFTKKADFPMGGDNCWLTVTAGPDHGIELLLESNENPIASTYQKSLYDNNMAATSFRVDDLAAEFKRLTGLGVRFTMEPIDIGPAKMARFDDTVGNLIGLHQ